MNRYTIDQQIKLIESNHGIIKNKQQFLNFFFEYACQTCEWEGIKTTQNPARLRRLMEDKMAEVTLIIMSNYEINPTTYITLDEQILNTNHIPLIVRKEHGGGVPIGTLRKGKTYQEWLKNYSGNIMR